MVYLYWYFGIGLAVIAMLYGEDRLKSKPNSNSDFIRDILDASDPNRTKLGYRIRHNILAPMLVAVSVLLLWPAGACLRIKEFFSKPNQVAAGEREFAVARSDLQERLSTPEIEDREIVSDPLYAVPDLPFGHLNAAWRRFLNDLAQGDEVWSFSAHAQTKWGTTEIREGYVEVRGGVPGVHLLTVRKEVAQE